MPATHPSRTLYRIDECPDLMADGCVGDEHGNLVFLSIWARDTAVQEFLARLTLGRDAQGLDQFHVITDQGARVPLFVGNVENLEKRITRAYRRTLFGSLTNVWLFDRRAVKPDKANASALALLPRESAQRVDRKRSTNPILPRARYAVINCSALRCQGRRASKCSTVVAVGKARSMWRSHRYGSTLLALAVSTSE